MGRFPVAVLKKWLTIAAGALVVCIAVYILSLYLPPGIDWDETFRPAALELLAGHNPHAVKGFLNPIWILIPILPFAWLPSSVGRAGYLLISLAGFGFAAYRLGAKPLTLSAFLLSPPVLHCLLNANVDWIPLIGFVLPPQIGIFLVMAKPQMSSTVILFWLISAARKGGLGEVIKIFAPVTIAMLLTFIVFGPYFMNYGKTLTYWWNASLWPASIPVGLALLVAAVRSDKIKFAMGAAPCLSPYLLLHSWAGALAAIVSQPIEALAAVIGLWILVILRYLG